MRVGPQVLPALLLKIRSHWSGSGRGDWNYMPHLISTRLETSTTLTSQFYVGSGDRTQVLVFAR